jgi:archaetidylinositol phosphate synthase
MAIYSVVKPMGQKMLKPLVNMLSVFNPNFLTFLGLLFSLCAGACFVMAAAFNKWLLLVVILFILLRMAFNVLDGMVARQTGRTSAYGEALAEFTDRLSDTGMLLGLVSSMLCTAGLGLLAIICILLASYVGILGKAVGAQRQFGGIMGKVDRLVLIILFCLANFFFPGNWFGWQWGLRNFDFLMVIFVMGSSFTVLQRWVMIVGQLAEQGKK